MATTAYATCPRMPNASCKLSGAHRPGCLRWMPQYRIKRPREEFQQVAMEGELSAQRARAWPTMILALRTRCTKATK